MLTITRRIVGNSSNKKSGTTFLGDLFNEELKNVIEKGAESERLNLVDGNYLRHSALRVRGDLLEQIHKESQEYLNKRQRIVGPQLDRKVPVKRIEPRPALYRFILLTGLALIDASVFLATPTVHAIPPPFIVPITAALLLIATATAAFAYEIGLNGWVSMPVTQASLAVGSAITIFLSVTTVASGPENTIDVSQSGTILVVSLPLVLIALTMPTLRWRRRFLVTRPKRRLSHRDQRIEFDYVPPTVVAVSVFACTVITLLIQGSKNKEIFFVSVDPTLSITGVIVSATAALLSLVTIRFQPKLVTVAELEHLDETFRKMLRVSVLMPFLKRTADEQVDSFDTAMQVGEAPGLSQMLDPLFQVSTRSTSRLTTLLDTMPGGSIGIAGPRGAGKSTLIYNFCETSASSLATIVSAPVNYLPREFLLHLYGNLCQRVLGYERYTASLLDPSIATASRRQWVSTIIYGFVLLLVGTILVSIPTLGIAFGTAQLVGVALAVVGLSFLVHGAVRQRASIAQQRAASKTSLDDMARERLNEIRYQQTISGSSTGATKLPIGIEATFANGRSFMQQQMSLPEIVASLRDFLEFAAKEKKVLIGIDELDKIGSGEKAIHFLNEIKGIFGVKGCFFLVSVSEEAMAGFERRGLPFRDAFDSAFDEIIRVEPLTLSESSVLLSRRLFGMPAPFKQLCYCHSGGLPRDLIRSARSAVSACDESAPVSLSLIAAKVVEADLAGKAAASMVVGHQPSCEPFASSVLEWCDALCGEASAVSELVNHVTKLHREEFVTVALGANDLPGYDVLQVLILELACYCYYSATVLDFFETSAPSARWHVTDPTISAERLARIRSYFSVSHILTWRLISEFRKELHRETIELPDWLMESRSGQP
jgi:hypothetical protein